jgi:hypothetical protein
MRTDGWILFAIQFLMQCADEIKLVAHIANAGDARCVTDASSRVEHEGFLRILGKCCAALPLYPSRQEQTRRKFRGGMLCNIS